MKFILSIFLSLAVLVLLYAQDSTYQNTASQILEADRKLSIRGYAQIDFNQPYDTDTRYNGKAEVHRMVLFLGYKFDDQLQFVSEIEIEHGNEVFVEQAFASYKISTAAQIRAGLILVPMGIINEYHEPTLFNGVERSNVDKFIVPSTWRELGIGLTGIIGNSGLRYQAYVINGFKSYDGQGLLNGINGLRSGRQKGIKSTLSSPNFSAKLDYFGVRNLKIGLAGYLGKTQSTLYNGIDKNQAFALAQADSSVVSVSMIGLDARYDYNGIEARAQYIITNLTGTAAYNAFAQKDLGKRMYGFLAEMAFDFLSLSEKKKTKALLAFVRYENYDTQASLDKTEFNSAAERTEITAGLTLRHNRSMSLKLDHQWTKNSAEQKLNIFNAGIGVWF